MEYAEGGTLMSLIEERNGVFTDEEVSEIIKNILIAVEYLHSKNVVHRDLKPGILKIYIFIFIDFFFKYLNIS